MESQTANNIPHYTVFYTGLLNTEYIYTCTLHIMFEYIAIAKHFFTLLNLSIETLSRNIFFPAFKYMCANSECCLRISIVYRNSKWKYFRLNIYFGKRWTLVDLTSVWNVVRNGSIYTRKHFGITSVWNEFFLSTLTRNTRKSEE